MNNLKVTSSKNLFLFLMLGIFLINFISAIDDQGIGKEGSNFTFLQTCDDATYITLSTHQFPNRSVENINTNMTSIGGRAFQYNFTNVVNGRHDVTGISDGCSKTFTTFFIVTTTGFLLETSESIIYIIILISYFILFLGFLYPAITIPYSNEINPDGSITKIIKLKYLKLLSIWFSYGFFMWFLQTLNAISTSFLKLDYLSNFITTIFTYTQSLSVGFTFLILIIIFVTIWKDILWNEQIKKHGKAFLDGRLK